MEYWQIALILLGMCFVFGLIPYLYREVRKENSPRCKICGTRQIQYREDKSYHSSPFQKYHKVKLDFYGGKCKTHRYTTRVNKYWD